MNQDKIKLTLSIQEIFKDFPDILAVDIIIKKNTVINMLSSQHEDQLNLIIAPQLDLQNLNVDINPYARMSYVGDLYSTESSYHKNKRIIDWSELEIFMDIQNKQFLLKSCMGKTYNYQSFKKDYLNFNQDAQFISELYQEAQIKNPYILDYHYRFIRNHTMTFFDFLGEDTVSAYEKSKIEKQVDATNCSEHHTFKI